MLETTIILCLAIFFTIISTINDFKVTTLDKFQSFFQRYIIFNLPVLKTPIQYVSNKVFSIFNNFNKINVVLHELNDNSYLKSMLVFEVQIVILFTVLVSTFIFSKELFEIASNLNDVEGANLKIQFISISLTIMYVVGEFINMFTKGKKKMKENVEKMFYIIIFIVFFIFVFFFVLSKVSSVDNLKDEFKNVSMNNDLPDYIVSKIEPYIFDMIHIIKLIGITNIVILIIGLYDYLKKSNFDEKESKKRNIVYGMCVMAIVISNFLRTTSISL